jgi:hypothetical protein
LPLSPHIGQGHVVGASSFADIRQHRLFSSKTVPARMGEEENQMISTRPMPSHEERMCHIQCHVTS